jgi:hypothetical protein
MQRKEVVGDGGDMLTFGRELSNRIGNSRLRRTTAICLVAFVTLPIWGMGTALAQQTVPNQPVNGAPPSQSQPQSAGTGTDSSRPGATQAVGENGAGVSKSAQEQQQSGGSQEPLGTAVAPYEKGIGIAASRPAGAVIAPAKQRRTRSFLIKVGLLVGAGVAVGTVVGLSKASPSQPH